MKDFFWISIMMFILNLSTAVGQIDTLRNFPKGIEMVAPKYINTGQHGYVLGHNHLSRQQYAEKYYINGASLIHGIVSHLTGVYANRENFVEFNVYTVGTNRLPEKKLASVQVLYPDLDLSGKEFFVPLSIPVAVSDSFYVTFNVQDYLHGGYDGDTIGLFCAKPGTRSKEDLTRFGRNAVQAHNHSKEDWKDFYTQNFTQIATHFALFPLIEKQTPTNTSNSNSEVGSVYKAYPNPFLKTITVPFEILEDSDISILISDALSKIIIQEFLGSRKKGLHQYTFESLNLIPGTYMLVVRSKTGVHTHKIIAL